MNDTLWDVTFTISGSWHVRMRQSQSFGGCTRERDGGDTEGDMNRVVIDIGVERVVEGRADGVSEGRVSGVGDALYLPNGGPSGKRYMDRSSAWW